MYNIMLLSCCYLSAKETAVFLDLNFLPKWIRQHFSRPETFHGCRYVFLRDGPGAVDVKRATPARHKAAEEINTSGCDCRGGRKK